MNSIISLDDLSLITEALDTPQDFYMTSNTDIPYRIEAAFKVGNTDYVFCIDKHTVEGIYFCKLAYVTAKQKRPFRFKTPSDILPALSTAIKILEAAAPFLGSRVSAFCIALPPKTSKDYNRLAKLMLRKTYLRNTFEQLPTDYTGASHQFLILMRKGKSPQNVFKGKYFKDYNFEWHEKSDEIPAKAIEDLKPMKPEKKITDLAPSKKWSFSDSIADFTDGDTDNSTPSDNNDFTSKLQPENNISIKKSKEIPDKPINIDNDFSTVLGEFYFKDLPDSKVFTDDDYDSIVKVFKKIKIFKPESFDQYVNANVPLAIKQTGIIQAHKAVLDYLSKYGQTAIIYSKFKWIRKELIDHLNKAFSIYLDNKTEMETATEVSDNVSIYRDMVINEDKLNITGDNRYCNIVTAFGAFIWDRSKISKPTISPDSVQTSIFHLLDKPNLFDQVVSTLFKGDYILIETAKRAYKRIIENHELYIKFIQQYSNTIFNRVYVYMLSPEKIKGAIDDTSYLTKKIDKNITKAILGKDIKQNLNNDALPYQKLLDMLNDSDISVMEIRYIATAIIAGFYVLHSYKNIDYLKSDINSAETMFDMLLNKSSLASLNGYMNLSKDAQLIITTVFKKFKNILFDTQNKQDLLVGAYPYYEKYIKNLGASSSPFNKEIVKEKTSKNSNVNDAPPPQTTSSTENPNDIVNGFLSLYHLSETSDNNELRFMSALAVALGEYIFKHSYNSGSLNIDPKEIRGYYDDLFFSTYVYRYLGEDPAINSVIEKAYDRLKNLEFGVSSKDYDRLFEGAYKLYLIYVEGVESKTNDKNTVRDNILTQIEYSKAEYKPMPEDTFNEFLVKRVNNYYENNPLNLNNITGNFWSATETSLVCLFLATLFYDKCSSHIEFLYKNDLVLFKKDAEEKNEKYNKFIEMLYSLKNEKKWKSFGLYPKVNNDVKKVVDLCFETLDIGYSAVYYMINDFKSFYNIDRYAGNINNIIPYNERFNKEKTWKVFFNNKTTNTKYLKNKKINEIFDFVTPELTVVESAFERNNRLETLKREIDADSIYDNIIMGRKTAIEEYTNYSFDVNGVLRYNNSNIDRKYTTATVKKIKQLCNVLSDMKKTKNDLVVYRNCDFPENHIDEGYIWDVNKDIIDAGFISTSIDSNIEYGWEGNTKLMIIIPKGSSNILPILDHSEYPDEYEILLPPASILRPVSIEIVQSENSESRMHIKQYIKCIYVGNYMKNVVDLIDKDEYNTNNIYEERGNKMKSFEDFVIEQSNINDKDNSDKWNAPFSLKYNFITKKIENGEWARKDIDLTDVEDEISAADELSVTTENKKKD